MTVARARSSFNLVDQPWLPVTLEGERAAEVGIREALVRAHQVRELVDPSPLVTAAAHRLLLAVLHRIFGPPTLRAWHALWTAEHFDAAKIDAYLDRWRARFDLFDPEHPFYQTPDLPERFKGPAAKLALETADSGSNSSLFDHGSSQRILAPEGARLLVAHQAFAIGGLVSRGKGEPPSARSAPLVGGAVVLASGATLFQTLLLNLLRYDSASHQPLPVQGDDAPAWEQPPLKEPVERRPAGYLDYLTWQSRRLLLFPGGDASAPQPEVAGVVIMKGAELPQDVEQKDLEPMMAFLQRQNPAKGMSPYQALRFAPSRATWRNSTALMQSVKGQWVRPWVLAWVDSLAAEAYLDRKGVVPVDLFGLTAEQKRVLLWRHERLPLPLPYLDESQRELAATLRGALGQAEGVARALREGVHTAVQLVLSPTADDSAQGRKPDAKAVNAVADGLAADRSYWAALEAPFRELLQALPSEVEEIDGAPTYGKEALPAWGTTLRRQARNAFEMATQPFAGTARGQKALARGRHTFERSLARPFAPLGGPDAG